MKTRAVMITAAIAAVLHCAPVNAQLLGGGASGGLGGTLSSGTRSVDMMMRGGADGSLGADLDTRPLRHRARGAVEGAGDRVQDTTSAVRSRTEKEVGAVRANATGAASAGAVVASAAAGSLDHVNSSAQGAGSLGSAANVEEGGTALVGTADQQANVSPRIPQVSAAESIDASSNAVGRMSGELRGKGETVASASGAAEQAPLDAELDGSASGDAEASKNGASAGTSASAQGSARVSRR